MKIIRLPLRVIFLMFRMWFAVYYWLTYRKKRLFFDKIQTILLIKLDKVGDVVLATPLVEALKRRYPKAHLTVLVSPQAVEVLDASPYVDDIIIHDASWLNQGFSLVDRVRDCFQTASFFKDSHFDLVLNPRDQNLLDSLLLSLLPGRYKVGYDVENAGFALTHRIKKAPYLHRVQRNLLLAEACGYRTVEPRLFLRVRMENEKITQAFFEGKSIQPGIDLIVGIHPGAGAPSKQWGQNNFIGAARYLAKHKAKILIFGGLSEIEAGKAIKRAVPEAINISGKTSVRQMASLMARCDVVLSNDSGPAHIAAAMGVPVALAFSGANDPKVWAPHGVPLAVLQNPVECSPCEKYECPLSGADFMKCLKPVSAEKMAREVLRLATDKRKKTI